ncbi:MAG: tetratricopeptide repeat protein, partial [Myxococcales bacterium]|nr:tetratricopeptide repeat protein [Myxococcales bacterium]
EGRLDEAEDYIGEALKIREQTMGAGHIASAPSLLQLAELHRRRGDDLAAKRLIDEAPAIIEAHWTDMSRREAACAEVRRLLREKSREELKGSEALDAAVVGCGAYGSYDLSSIATAHRLEHRPFEIGTGHDDPPT